MRRLRRSSVLIGPPVPAWRYPWSDAEDCPFWASRIRSRAESHLFKDYRSWEERVRELWRAVERAAEEDGGGQNGKGERNSRRGREEGRRLGKDTKGFLLEETSTRSEAKT